MDDVSLTTQRFDNLPHDAFVGYPSHTAAFSPGYTTSAFSARAAKAQAARIARPLARAAQSHRHLRMSHLRTGAPRFGAGPRGGDPARVARFNSKGPPGVEAGGGALPAVPQSGAGRFCAAGPGNGKGRNHAA